jgi:hypothetical protein
MNYSTFAIRVVVIYRPPLSAGNGLTMNFFFGEFSNFLEQMITDPKLIIILLPRPQALIKKFHASHYMKVYMK